MLENMIQIIWLFQNNFVSLPKNINNMSKYIGKDSDRYGNVIYVIGFNENGIEFSTDLRKAILLSDDDKKLVGKVLKKQYKPNIKYVKLEKFESIHQTTYNVLIDYEQDYYATKNLAKLLRQEDDMSLECIDFAKNRIEEVNTFEEFGNTVASILIEKYNLQKKEQ